IAQLLYWLARLYSQMSQDLGRGHKHSHCRSALASGPATNGDGHQVAAVVDHLGEAAGGPLVDVTGHVSAAIGTDRDSVGVVLIIGLAEQRSEERRVGKECRKKGTYDDDRKQRKTETRQGIRKVKR